MVSTLGDDELTAMVRHHHERLDDWNCLAGQRVRIAGAGGGIRTLGGPKGPQRFSRPDEGPTVRDVYARACN